MSPTVHILYNDAGGGHRAAASAIASALAISRPQWNVKLLNPIADLPNNVDLLKRLTGISVDKLYSRIVGLGSLDFLCAPLFSLFRQNISAHSREIEEIFAKYFAYESTDLVVSVIPWINKEIRNGLRQVNKHAPFVTVMTDFEEYRSNFWNCGGDQNLVCPTDRAEEQALRAGLPRNQVFRVSGIVLNPRYYEVEIHDREKELLALGLTATKPVGLVSFGAYPTNTLLECCRSLNECKREVQAIFVCGHNKGLSRAIEKIPSRYRKAVVGFTDQIPLYSMLADFFIGKPGALSISEAVAMGLPVLLQEQKSYALPHERYNLQWIENNKFGRRITRMSEIHRVVDEFLEPTTWHGYKNNLAHHQNRAVFEVVELLNRLLCSQGKVLALEA